MLRKLWGFNFKKSNGDILFLDKARQKYPVKNEPLNIVDKKQIDDFIEKFFRKHLKFHIYML